MDKTLTINSKELALSRLRDAGGYIERELETLADPDFVQRLGEGLLKAEGAEALGTAYANSLRERLTELRQIIGDTPDASMDHIPDSILEELEENVNFLPFSASDNAERNEWIKDQLERIRILRGCFEVLAQTRQADSSVVTAQYMASLEHDRAESVIKENNTLRRKANLVKDVSRVLQRLESLIAGSHPDALRVFFGNVGYAELLELKASIIRIVEGSKDECEQIKSLRIFDIPGPTEEAKLDDAMPRTWLQDNLDEIIESRGFTQGRRYEKAPPEGTLKEWAEKHKLCPDKVVTEVEQYIYPRCPDYSHVHAPDGRIEPFTGQKINGTLHAGESKAKNTGAWFDRLDAYLRQAPYDFRNPGYVSPLGALAALELLRKAFKEEAEGRDILRGELDRAKEEYVKDRQELDARLVALNERHRESLDRAEAERVVVNTALLMSAVLNRRMGHTTRAVDKTLRVIEKAITKLLEGKIWEWRTDYIGLSEGDAALNLSAEIKALAISAAEACRGELELYDKISPVVILSPETATGDKPETEGGLRL